MNKLLDTIHEANSWLFYAATIIIASAGKAVSWLTTTAMDVQSTVIGTDVDAVLTVGPAGKMYIWGVAVTDTLYALLLLVTIIGAILKAWVDLSNFLYKRKIRNRKRRSTDKIDGE